MSITAARTPVLGASSLAAAMLMAMPTAGHAANEALSATAATSAEAAAEAEREARRNEILVIGRNEEVDIGTLRGAVIDLPQTVSIVPKEVLEQRQVNTLADALRNVAGVTTQVGEGGVVSGDQFLVRGQSARNDIFTDGLRDFGVFTRDSFNYESVQVLKGSSSTALGRGVSGGAINTQSKRALDTDAFYFSGSAGTDKYVRGQGDANFTIGDTSAIRLNFVGHTNDAVDRDHAYSRRWGVAPTIGFGIGTDTRFDLIFFHQEEERLVDYGVPVAQTSNTTDIERPVTEYGVARSNFYGLRNNRDDVTVNTLTARLTHTANDWLELSSDTKVGAYKRKFMQTVPSCNDACGDALTDNDPLTVPMAGGSVRGQQRSTTRGIQNVSTALITKPLGGLRSELLIGWDVSYQTNDREDDARPAAITQSLFAPTLFNAIPATGLLYQTRDTRISDFSLFLDERLWIADTLSINAGLRYQHFKATQEQIAFLTSSGGALTSCNGVTGAFNACRTTGKVTENLLNPKISLIWEPNKNLSFYGSYSTAQMPQGNSVNNGDTLQDVAPGNSISRTSLKPEKTKTFDLGAKASLFGDRLLVQAAVYQIDRSNATEVDPLSNLIIASSEPKQRLRGFELGTTGTITPDFALNFNYSYVDAEIREAFTGNPAVIDTAAIGKQVRYVPKHAVAAWANYKPLSGALKGLEVGGGVNYQSRVFLNSQNDQATPAYTTLDALLAYSVGGLRLAVNGFNLTDKLYYGQVNGNRVVPAGGRSVLFSVSAGF